MNCDPAWNGYWAYPLPQDVMAHADHWHQAINALALFFLAAYLVAVGIDRWRKT